jgi:hypothetical protein
MTATIGVLTVLAAYMVTKKWFNQNAALAAALVTAASPLMVIHSRLAYHISPIPLVSWWFVHELFKLTKKQTNWFWPVFVWGVLLQFELTALPLGLLIPLAGWWGKIKWRRGRWLPVVVGALIPFLPKIIFDLTHGFKQTLGLVAWAGYRTITPWRSFSEVGRVSQTIFNYWQKWVIYDKPLIAVTMFVGLLLLAILKKRKLILSYLLVNLFAFYLHGGPSEAYFPVLFPVWTLMMALPFYYFSSRILWAGLLFLSIYNSNYLLNRQMISYGPNLSNRLEAVYLIKHLSKGQEVKLETFASLPRFSAYLDNYRYLLWWRGVKFHNDEGKRVAIYDGDETNFFTPHGAMVYHLQGQKVIVYD